MFRKSLSLLMALVMALALVPTVAFAATPPTTIKAPKNIGTTFYYNACWFVTTMSAQDDLRAILSQTAEERGYSVQVNAQVDFKIDSGDWHYTSEWDTDPMKYATAYYNNINEVSAQRFGKFIGAAGRINYKYLFPDDPQLSEDNVGEWLKSHTVTTRARYMLSFNGGSAVFSDWSETYTVTGKAPVDFKGIINSSKPTLTSSALEYYAGKPQMNVLFTEPSDAIQKLSAAAGGTILTEVWLRKDGDKEFKKIGDWSMNEEKIAIDVGAYFPGTSQKEFDAAKYEVRTRYVFRSSNYFPAYEDVFYYSPFSNIIAYNMPAWADASAWATDTLKKADELGLIPDVLKGADLKKPITRKEFAAVCVKIYENLSGTMTTPFSPNPFTDTNDTEVLKAYNFGLMVGTAADKFSPDTILNREQAATALTNVLKRNLPGWQKGVTYTLNFTQPAKFADDAKISDWAKPSVYFMVANGIISGMPNNIFAPKNTTSAEQAANYASATREQALVLGVKMVENLKGKTIDFSQSAPSQTQTGGLTLADIVKAAETAGYTVYYSEMTRDVSKEKDYQNLTDRCLIEIVIKAADGSFSLNQTVEIFECKTAADAQANSKLQPDSALTYAYAVSDIFFVPYLAQPQANAQKAKLDCINALLQGQPIKPADLLSVK